MCWNTAGIIINTRPGPWFGEKPSAKTAGKITRPARIEIPMFIQATFIADEPRRTSFLNKKHR